jgi:DNA primase
VPGVDYDRVRTEITMEQVLSLLGFCPASRSGAQWYGRCPLHEPGPGRRGRRRSFSVNVAIGRYFCHSCRSHGNHLELWSAATKLPLHQAAIDLCHRLGRDIPWIKRW